MANDVVAALGALFVGFRQSHYARRIRNSPKP